jgi:hypothetical protein
VLRTGFFTVERFISRLHQGANSAAGTRGDFRGAAVQVTGLVRLDQVGRQVVVFRRFEGGGDERVIEEVREVDTGGRRLKTRSAWYSWNQLEPLCPQWFGLEPGECFSTCSAC